ncbi:hypothetical protein K402DRAFT_420179 [Aulographum hederae CBS 113979]|uniref:Uncharacterized protein n=1 Tax=Aulographum hederae CBS 113979 TaxID=1176131 RepID=A0A6G1H454_9PEZI|nr:hypothetical protein K402DRAFT_420179 [Aulographum hederae CBS 113979]
MDSKAMTSLTKATTAFTHALTTLTNDLALCRGFLYRLIQDPSTVGNIDEFNRLKSNGLGLDLFAQYMDYTAKNDRAVSILMKKLQDEAEDLEKKRKQRIGDVVWRAVEEALERKVGSDEMEKMVRDAVEKSLAEKKVRVGGEAERDLDGDETDAGTSGAGGSAESRKVNVKTEEDDDGDSIMRGSSESDDSDE